MGTDGGWVTTKHTKDTKIGWKIFNREWHGFDLDKTNARNDQPELRF